MVCNSWLHNAPDSNNGVADSWLQLLPVSAPAATAIGKTVVSLMKNRTLRLVESGFVRSPGGRTANRRGGTGE